MVGLLDTLVPRAVDERWMFVAGDDGPSGEADESRLCLSDGLVGTRGCLEEQGAETRPAIYVGGVFERSPDGTELPLAVPGWVALPLRQPVEIGFRVLDLRTGVVTRLVGGDGVVALRSARWASLARPGTAVLVADGRAVLPETLTMHETIEERSSLGGGVSGEIGTVGVRTPAEGGRGGVVVRVAAYDTWARAAPPVPDPSGTWRPPGRRVRSACSTSSGGPGLAAGRTATSRSPATLS